MSKLEWHLPWLIGLLTGIVCYLLLYHSGFSNIHSKSICFGLIIAAIHLQLASPSTQLRQWLLPAVLVGIAFAYLGISLTNRQSFEPLVTLQLPLALLISTSFHQVYCREQKAHFPYQLLFFHA